MNKSRKISNLYNVLTYDETGHLTAPAGLTLGTAPASSDNSSKAASTAWIRTYVAGQSYATSASVTSAIAALVDTAPTTLDTLNELAAALGDDPNFATTVTASIGTKVPQARTITINGTAYDLSADRSWTIAAGLTSFNTRTGAITLTSGDVTGALGFTPYNATNPSGYITGITSGMVTTALGYTPYNSSNPNGYITASSLSSYLPLAGGTLTGLVTFAFSNTDAVEWPKIRFGPSSTGWDEGIIKASTAEGVFGRYGMGVHFDSARAFGIYSAGWTKVFGFKSDEVRSYVNLTVNGNTVLHAGNYTSYTDGRYWLNNGSWLADLGSSGFTRIFGNETSGGGFAILTNPNGGGQTSVLIDGSYISGENNGFYSLGSANQYSSRRGWYNDGSTINFRTNNSVVSTANIRVYPVSEGWAEGLSFIMPTTTTWGGLRWQRQRANNDGNWGIGFTALDATDDLVFSSNNGGTQIDNILRLYKTGNVLMQGSLSVVTVTASSELRTGKLRADTNGTYGTDQGWWSHDPYGYSWGKPHGSFRSLEVSSSADFSNEPAMFRIHQWGSGAAEFWKPKGTILYLRETPGGSNTWFTRFQVQRELYVEGDVVAYASDMRLKENHQPLENALSKVLSLTGLTFDWKSDVSSHGFSPKNRHEVGVLAQQVQAVLPEAVVLAPFDDDGTGASISGDNYLTVKYEKLSPLLIEAIKEQQAQIEAQGAQITELMEIIKTMKGL